MVVPQEEEAERKRKRKVTAEPVAEAPHRELDEFFNVPLFVDDEVDKSLRSWLQENAPRGSSAAQASFNLVQQIWKDGGELKAYLHWCLQPTEPHEKKVRNLFPLPLWHDDVLHLTEAIQDLDRDPNEVRKREQGETRSQAQRAQRLKGLKTWHGLIVVALNFMHGCRARPDKGPPPGSAAIATQEAALTRLWDKLKVFMDDKGKKGVPRTPLFDWQHELGELKVSYTGEVVEKAMPLTLRQILPGLPSPEQGGMVDLCQVLPGDLAERIQDPARLVKEDFDGPMPKPRVLCGDDEWPLVAKAMYERGLVGEVTSVPKVNGRFVMNGAFGVTKAGKTIDTGEDVLRLIMDLRATNWLLEQVNGDTALLTGAATFQRVVIEENDTLLVSGEDLTAAFYLFKLPAAWMDYMVLGKPVERSVLGLEGPGEVYLGLKVLPMGWHSSVGLMQAAHRRIALGSPFEGGAGLCELAEINRKTEFPSLDESAGWSIYLDDTTILEKVKERAVESLKGKLPEEQRKLRAAYSWWGIPTNESKALVREQEAERLGAVLNGKVGVLRTSTERALELVSLGSWIRSQEFVDRKSLQIYAGKAVHILQFRRCLFSVMEVIFTTIAQEGRNCPVKEPLRSEMLLLEMLLPMAQFNMKAQIDPMVTASDASETGGGMCYASRLSRAGEEEAKRLLEGVKLEEKPKKDPARLDPNEKVLVIDLFAGIGGFTAALQRAGISWDHLLIVESDKNCRRLLRRTYPGAEFLNDVKLLDKKMLKKMIDKVPGITGILVGGGSPCQGLSKLSSLRAHLDDERSALFFEASRIFKEVEEIASLLNLWFLNLLENVVPDKADIKVMSKELGMRPVLVDSQYLSRARRPRLFWLSSTLEPAEDVSIQERENFDQVIYRGKVEPMASFLQEGCDWPGGLRDEKMRFPTFTRAIPRRRPPPDPVGLSSAEPAAKARWESDRFRFPPYTYHDDFMILSESCELRPLVADEREVLMGYPKGHTKKLWKKTPEKAEDKEEAEDVRLSAIGNAFHVKAVAVLLDHALSSMGLKQRAGTQVILDKFDEEEKEKDGKRGRSESQGQELEVKRESSDNDDALSVMGNLTLEKEERLSQSRELLEERCPPERLPKAVVAAFIRRQEFRGSDVRLDIGSLYRPDSVPRGSVQPGRWIWHVGTSYPFQQEEHINVLELRTIVHSFEWRARKANYGDLRSLHLSDSQVSLAVATKGRSSSRALNRLLRRFCSLQIATGVHPLLSWIESEDNPADEPSRRYEPKA